MDLNSLPKVATSQRVIPIVAVENDSSVIASLYASDARIYARSVSGWFNRWRWAMVALRRSGTAWRTTRMPLSPLDYDPRCENVAHPSLQLESCPAPGTPVSLWGINGVLAEGTPVNDR